MNAFLRLKHLINRKNIFFFFLSLIFVSCSKSPEELRSDSDKYFEQAVDYYERGYSNNARDLFIEVLEIEDQLRLTDKSGDVYLYLGLIAFENGDYTGALNFYQNSREIFKKKFVRRMEGLAENNIGSVYSGLGKYSEAMESYSRALGISQLSADKEGEAIAQLNIGMLYAEQNNFQMAFNHFQKSFDAYSVLRNIEGQVSASNKIGEAYLKFGSYEDALSSFEYSLERAESYGLRSLTFSILNNTGLTYFKLQKYNDAVSAFNYGLELMNSYEEDPVSAWTFLNNLGDSYTKLFRFDEALENYSKAIELSDKFGEGLNSAIIKLKSADLRFQISGEKEHGASAKIFSELFDFFDDVNYAPGKIHALAGTAKIYYARESHKEAFENLNKIEKILNNNSASFNNRLTENYALHPEVYSPSVFFPMFASLDKGNELLEYAFRSDAVSAVNFLESIYGIDLEIENYEGIRSAEREAEFLRFELANEQGKISGYANSERLNNLEDLYKENKHKKELISRRALAEKFNLHNNISLKALQKKLKKDEGIFSVISDENFLTLSVIQNGKNINKVVPHSGAALDRQIESLVINISTGDTSAAKLLLKGIYSRILKPVENELAPLKNIIVYFASNENSNLFYLPVHALIDDNGRYFSSIKNIKYFGGFNNKGGTGAGSNMVLISDNLTITNGLKTNETEITKIKTSSSAKEELLSLHPGNLIFLSPVYISGSQPSTSYFECFSDSASSPELNLRIGEAATLSLKTLFTLNYVSDKAGTVRYFTRSLPSIENILISKYNLPEKNGINILQNYIDRLADGEDMISISKANTGLYWSSVFHYIKL